MFQNPKSPFFDKLWTFIKPNSSIIIAGDKYKYTPKINQSFGDTVGDITLRENQSGHISNNHIFTPP